MFSGFIFFIFYFQRNNGDQAKIILLECLFTILFEYSNFCLFVVTDTTEKKITFVIYFVTLRHNLTALRFKKMHWPTPSIRCSLFDL